MAPDRSTKVSQACSFDYLYNEVLLPFFATLDDNRAFNFSYYLLDALKAGFSIYSLKIPSLYQFQKRAQAEDYNLSTVYKIGAIPSDNGLRKLLDGVNPEHLRQGFRELFEHATAQGLLRRYRVWGNYVAASVDGVQHFQSKSVSCEQCLQRKHRDGTTSNYHSMLSAALVKPGLPQVMPLDHEPIIRQDGTTKNDCERNAIHRLLDHFQKIYSQLDTIFILDALYGCAPVIERLEAVDNWRYLIGVKDKGHAHLFEQFDDLDAAGKLKWKDYTRDGISYEVGYANGLSLNLSHADQKTNLLYARLRDRKGKVTVFSFITNIRLTKQNVAELLDLGRSRWKIENETFNTLKNQDYHFEHNYGHGQQHLCTVMAYLMLLAFWVDQLQELANQTFAALHSELRTRVKLWDAMRSVFRVVAVDSMAELHGRLIDMYCVRLI